MNRRGFLGRIAGGFASLPILAQSRPGLINRRAFGKLRSLSIPAELTLRTRTLTMNPDIDGQYAFTSSLSQDESINQHTWSEAGFGVIYYLDPRGLFQVCDTDADI